MGEQVRLCLSSNLRVQIRPRLGLVPRHRRILSEQREMSVEGDPVGQ